MGLSRFEVAFFIFFKKIHSMSMIVEKLLKTENRFALVFVILTKIQILC